MFFVILLPFVKIDRRGWRSTSILCRVIFAINLKSTAYFFVSTTNTLEHNYFTLSNKKAQGKTCASPSVK